VSLTCQPRYRSILAIDVEGSATRNNSAKAQMRDAMYDLIIEALALNGLSDGDHDPFVDRGDGILALIHPTDRVPKTLLLRSVIPTLGRLMTLHNLHYSAEGFRLRVVLHAGEVHVDGRAPFGEALDLAFRLLDADETKLALRRSTAPLVLVISNDLYWSVVRHGYDGIDPKSFSPFVTERHANVLDQGWLHVPVRARRSVLDSDLDYRVLERGLSRQTV
jgi:hypothetical protein